MQCNVKDFSLNIDKPEYKSQVLSTIPAISAKSQETIAIITDDTFLANDMGADGSNVTRLVG